jgi:hypothetical protein
VQIDAAGQVENPLDRRSHGAKQLKTNHGKSWQRSRTVGRRHVVDADSA